MGEGKSLLPGRGRRRGGVTRTRPPSDRVSQPRPRRRRRQRLASSERVPSRCRATSPASEVTSRARTSTTELPSTWFSRSRRGAAWRTSSTGRDFADRDGAELAFYERRRRDETLLHMNPMVYGLEILEPVLERLCRESGHHAIEDARGAGSCVPAAAQGLPDLRSRGRCRSHHRGHGRAGHRDRHLQEQQHPGPAGDPGAGA